AFFIHGLIGALSSSTQGRSPVPKLGTPGSVRGVFSNGHPYRNRRFDRCPRHAIGQHSERVKLINHAVQAAAKEIGRAHRRGSKLPGDHSDQYRFWEF
ncbi:hypothetical protein, partial [Candidatus Burkholderia verschuerenii]|uniref:hypothetical protein n=1 Tax=Candidatus Burkholderia verschuerenii TaxID=242163 RepID=UPI001E2C3858